MQSTMLRLPGASARTCIRQAKAGSATVGIFHISTRRIGLQPPCAQPEQQSAPKPAAKEEQLPPWVRREKEKELQAQAGVKGLPWPLYLLFSVFTAIAAVGSTFEFLAGNPIFGVLPADNPLWAPILLLFAVTGLPTAGYLFIKGVNGFNEEAELQDKVDGYL